MVIRYGYLWTQQHERGQEEGKNRPAAVIVVLDDHPLHPLVTVLPITHIRPAELGAGIEIPALTKQRLDLLAPGTDTALSPELRYPPSRSKGLASTTSAPGSS